MTELDLSKSCKRCPMCRIWIEYDNYIFYNLNELDPYYPHYTESKLNKLWLSEYVKILCCSCRTLLQVAILFARHFKIIREKVIKCQEN